MCFIEKKNCIRICKREDHVPDPVRTPGRVGYWDASIPHRFFLFSAVFGAEVGT